MIKEAVRVRIEKDLADYAAYVKQEGDNADLGVAIKGIADRIFGVRFNDKGEPDPEGDWELVMANKKTGQIVALEE